MSEIMTIEEVNRKFESEWVLLGDPESDEHRRPLRGKLLAHSKDRDAFDRKLLEFRPRNAALHFTGRIPDDVTYLL